MGQAESTRGLFVVFEGGDCTGKSSQVKALATSLELSGIDYVVTHQPGDTPESATIRQMLLDPSMDLDDRCESLLYAADKAQHVSRLVRPALDAGQVVICDRYVDSMLAYQGAGRGIDASMLASIARWASYDLRPDLTVLLDSDPRTAVDTKKVKDRLERAGLDFHMRVRQGFLDLAASDPDRYLVLTALTSLPGIAAKVRGRVEQLLGQPLVVPELPDPPARSAS